MNDCSSEKSPVLKSLYGFRVECRAAPDAAKAVTSWEETDKCTKGTAGVWVQASREGFAEITLGTTTFQQGLAATCKDSSCKDKSEAMRGFWWGA